MATRPSVRERAEPRDMAELRRLRAQHPELAPAVDMQLELLEIQRRVLPRISLPAALLGPTMPVPHADGRPLLTWDALPIEWAEFRSLLRETVEVLLRSGNIDAEDARFLTSIARDGNRLTPFAETWFRQRVEGQPPASRGHANPDLGRAADPAFDNALALAFRPFLVRCADAVGQALNTEGWQRGICPLCGGEPELAIYSEEEADRLLVCGRCTLRWPYFETRCPFCENTDPAQLRSFVSPDRVYRLSACDVCLRYVKAYDERRAARPAMPSVDVIAMLPLDAVAMQRGYTG